MAKHSDVDFDVFAFEGRPASVSSADPDVLARAVRAHKAGDAFAQAAITFTLMVAIGAVAFVLSADRAAAAAVQILGTQNIFTPLLVGATLVTGAVFAARAASARLRRVPVRVRARR